MSETLTDLRWAVSDGWTVARRNLTHVRYMPEKLMDVTLQPILFVLLFTYVFGSAIHVSGVSYKDFLMAGIFAQTLTFTCAGTAISMADDMSKGVVDRFRSLPIARSAVLVGRTSADLVTGLIGLAILVTTATLIGWRVHDGIPDRDRRARAAHAVRLRDELARHPRRAHGARPRVSAAGDVPGRVPAELHLQRVRAHRGDAAGAAGVRPVEPAARGGGCPARPVRQRTGPDHRALAGHPSRSRLAGVVVGHPCGVPAPGGPPLPLVRRPLNHRVVV